MVQLRGQQKQFYHDNGYVLLKNAIPAEDLEKISKEFDQLFTRTTQNSIENCNRTAIENQNGRKSLQSIKGIQDLQYHHAVFNKYIFNETLLDVVEDILGTENIILHHTFGCCTLARHVHPMHQDYHYFPHEKNTLVAALLHLDTADPEQGSIFVYPGSQKLGPLEDFGAKEGNYHFVDQSRFPLENAVPVAAGRGDILLLSYLLVHGSSPNRSDKHRRFILSQMASAEDRPLTNQPLKPCQGLMLRGTNVNRDASISKRFETQ